MSLELLNCVNALDQFVCVEVRKLDPIFVHILHERDILPQTLRMMRNQLNLAYEVRLYLLHFRVQNRNDVRLKSIGNIQELALNLGSKHICLLWIWHGQVLGQNGSFNFLLIILGDDCDVAFLRALQLLGDLLEFFSRFKQLLLQPQMHWRKEFLHVV